MTEVSVIIPTWDRADQARSAALVALAQRGVDLEVLVVDDGSTDDTLELLADIEDPRLQVLPRAHEGVAVARQAGIEAATGRWVAMLDTDDRPRPGWLAHLGGLATRTGAPVVCAAVAIHQPDGRIELVRPRPLGPVYADQCGSFLAGAWLAEREIVLAVGGYRKGLAYSENTDLGMRLCEEVARRGAAVSCDAEVLVDVRVRHVRHDAAVRYEAAVTMLEVNGARLAREPRMLALYEGIAGVQAGRLGRTPEERSRLWRAWRTHPASLRHLARWSRAWLRPPVGRSSGR